ncbi:MAG: hypothetical protein U0694_15400 [Anaerolineae bacterium]
MLSHPSPKNLRWLWLLPLLLLMTALAASRLNADAIWLDEWWSIYHAGGAQYGPVSVAETWNRVATEDPWNAPGYYTVLKGWGALVGWTAYADRAFSLLFGLLAAAMAYRMGRDVGKSHTIGMGAAVALGGSAFFIYYLHELRAYTLYAFLVTFMLWVYWRVVYGQGGRLAQFGLFFGVAAMLYTHYFSALLAAALGLYHLLFVLPRKNETASKWRPLLLMGAGGVLFLPWVGVLLDGLRRGSNAAVRQEPISEALTMISTIGYAFSSGFVILMLLIFGAALFALFRRSSFAPLRLGGSGIVFAWFIASVVLVLALALNAYMSVNAHARHFMVLMPPLALLAGIGIRELARHRVSPAIILTLWLAAAVWNSFSDFNDVLFGAENQQYFRIHLPWNTMAADLRAEVQEGDIIAFSVPENSQPVSGVFEYYMRPLNVPMAIMEWWKGDETTVSQFEATASAYTQDAMRLWLGQETDQTSGAWLAAFHEVVDSRFVSCGTSIELNGLRADLYARLPQCCAPPQDADQRVYSFGTSVALTFAQPEISGDSLHVLLAWLGGNTLPPYQYSVALHITPAGENVAPLAQTDYGLPLDAFACRAADIPLTDLPAGNYDLNVIVYDWQTNQRLLTETGDHGTVETFEISR